MMITSVASNYGLQQRVFDLQREGLEVNRTAHPLICGNSSVCWNWGVNLQAITTQFARESGIIMNERRRGFFLFETQYSQLITSHYSLEVLISNVPVPMVLARLVVVLVARSLRESIGNGALSSAWSFQVLPRRGSVRHPRVSTLVCWCL